MDIHEALDLWMAKRMSVKELFMATGLRSISGIYSEVLFETHDIENEEEMAAFMQTEIDHMDQEALEAHAWEKWGDWRREEPDYLEVCVRMLRYERQRQLKEIGRRMTIATANKTLN